jgi:isopenicillin N synthase-like dioxygenase
MHLSRRDERDEKEPGMTALPIIDIAPFLSGDPEGKRIIAERVNAACIDTGFLIVVNHGVDPSLPDRVFDLGKQFFDLPYEGKRKVEKIDGRGPAGYHMFAHQTNGLRYRNLKTKEDFLKVAPDLRESFGVGPERTGVNRWLPEPEGFREVCLAYYASLEDLAFSMIRLFALALKLPENYFAPMIDHHDSTMLLHHYPAQHEAPREDQWRSSPHTDLGMFTLLRHERDHKAGLQLIDKAGGWIDVPHVEDAFIVNIADTMMQWTNDKWVSTMHRVANPPAGAGNLERRIALPFFFNINQDATIECLPSCCDADHPPKYAAVNAGEYRREKNKATYEFMRKRKEIEAELRAEEAAEADA